MFGLGTFFLSVRLDSVISFFNVSTFLVEVEFQVILMVFTEGPVAPGEVDVIEKELIKSYLST